MSRAVAVEVQPIDRLEEKVKQMVSVIDSLRAEKSRALDESARLQQEINGLKSRLDEGASAASEATTLREERELIRSRVSQMLTQIDKLNL
jgi:regulator of replication initiation timing